MCVCVCVCVCVCACVRAWVRARVRVLRWYVRACACIYPQQRTHSEGVYNATHVARQHAWQSVLDAFWIRDVFFTQHLEVLGAKHIANHDFCPILKRQSDVTRWDYSYYSAYRLHSWCRRRGPGPWHTWTPAFPARRRATPRRRLRALACPTTPRSRQRPPAMVGKGDEGMLPSVPANVCTSHCRAGQIPRK